MYYPQLTTHILQLTTNYLLLTTYYLQLITYNLLLTYYQTHYKNVALGLLPFLELPLPLESCKHVLPR